MTSCMVDQEQNKKKRKCKLVDKGREKQFKDFKNV